MSATIATKPEADSLKLAVRGTPAWVAWIDRAAEQTERTRSSLLAAALQAFAEANDLEPPPPRV